MGTDFLVGPVATGQEVFSFKLKEGRFRLDIVKKFYDKGGEPHKGCSSPTRGNIQSWIGMGSE